MPKKPWDLTSTHALEGACEWIREKSGALMVVAIRVDDSAIAADPAMPARELLPRLALEMEELATKLAEARRVSKSGDSGQLSVISVQA
jgi:hypothetical protein